MSRAPIDDLVNLSGLSHNNPQLIVKRAVEYVDKMSHAGREILGLSFTSLPTGSPSRVLLRVKSADDEKFKDQYNPPDSYHQQLAVACFLYAVASVAGLDNRATILCTNASGRGDTQLSISTKHCKSKLQENLRSLLDDNELIQRFKDEILPDLPEGLSVVQRALIVESVEGEINRTALNRIKKNHDVDDLEVYAELETLRQTDGLRTSLIPRVKFPKFPIDEVVEMLQSQEISNILQGEIDFLEQELEGAERKTSLFEEELAQIKSRSLFQRIFNR
jgi:hypothetical protein